MSKWWYSKNVTGTRQRRGAANRHVRRLKAEVLEERWAMTADMLLTGAGVGGGPHVRAYESPSMNQMAEFFAYPSTFTGGVHVASGDVNGDGHADMITGAGAGGGPHLRVLDGHTGQVISEFFAFDGSFNGGIHVAAGDINQDGRAEVFVGADGPTSGGRVRVFNGTTGAMLHDLIGPGGSFTGGVRVAAGDFNADGRSDLVMAAGTGSAPRIVVRDLSSGQNLLDFMAYSPAFGGGVYVAAGDISGDGRADIVTGADTGGGPHVRVFDGTNAQEIRGFFAYGTSFSGGVRVAITDYNQDGVADIVTGAGPGGGPHVRIFDGNSLAELHGFFAYAPSFTGGVFPSAIAGSLTTFPGPGGNPFPGTPGPGSGNADLTGSQLRIPDLARWGDNVFAFAGVRNNGTADSGNFQTQWYLSQDPLGSDDDILLNRHDSPVPWFDHPSLAPNSVGPTFTVMLELPAALPASFTGQSFYIVMRTDAFGQVSETNESNNFGESGNGVDREPITITTTPPPNVGFRVDVVARTLMTPATLAAFQYAASVWSQIIVGDLPDIGFFTDDVVIDAFAVPIDGPSGILGSAGPVSARIGTYANLPFFGQMMFDTADLAMLEADGRLTDVILHEMGHVLGIGTLWQLNGLILNSGLPDPRFRGALATQEYNRIFGRNDSSVPIESFFTAGPGSAEGHFRESVFDNELMTPFAEAPGVPNPISRITAASLADLGYHVNMSSPFINPFTPPAGATAFLTAPMTVPAAPLTDPVPAGFITEGPVTDPTAYDRVIAYLRDHRPSLDHIPHIDVSVFSYLTTPTASAQLANAAVFSDEATSQSLTLDVIEPIVRERPVQKTLRSVVANPATTGPVRATDLVFAERRSAAEQRATLLDLLADELESNLSLPAQKLRATALAK